VRGDGPGRVLMVLHEDVLGGATLSVLRCVPGLEERGWEFTFWAPRPSEVFDRLAEEGRDVAGAERPLAYSLRGLMLPPGPLRRLSATPRYVRSFRAHVRGAGVDLIHANSLTTIGEGAAASSMGPSIVFHLHEMASGGPKGRIAVRLAHRLADATLAVSRSCAESWRVGTVLPTVVYEGCSVPAAPAPLPDGPRLNVGTVGVIARRKGIDVFLDAVEIVKRRGAQIDFSLIGAPTDPLDAEWGRSELERARALGVHHEPRADVERALAGWDLFVLASRRDPFPISMLEAMAQGRPVIGARVDGITEQVSPAAGLLVEPEDPAALADALVELAGLAPERRREMGAAAHRRASEFSIQRQVEGIDAVYRGLLGR
jgi:glycosyltransferase involved in cell wall biosynthesis